MTTRIRTAFDQAAAESRAALVVYICAGDPDLPTTLKLLTAVSEAGADVIELGVPFSDPTADGIVIQRASERALRAGTTLKGVLDVVRQARQSISTPILLFGYYNPLLAYGTQRIVEEAKAAGVDGFLVVDLPPDSDEPLSTLVAQHGLAYIPLVAPTSSQERVQLACDLCNGFVYYVSLTGVTGSSDANLEKAAGQAAAIAARAHVPVAVGFGIKTPTDVATVARQAQGVVVGSAVVSLMEHAVSPAAGIEAVAAFIRQLKSATGRRAAGPAGT
jgi:tryptophan synthase alpha chain